MMPRWQETENRATLTIAVGMGLEDDDIEVQIVDHILYLFLKHQPREERQEERPSSANVHRRHVINLDPQVYNEDGIKAHFSECRGILEISIPKKTIWKSRICKKIPIHRTTKSEEDQAAYLLQKISLRVESGYERDDDEEDSSPPTKYHDHHLDCHPIPMPSAAIQESSGGGYNSDVDTSTS